MIWGKLQKYLPIFFSIKKVNTSLTYFQQSADQRIWYRLASGQPRMDRPTQTTRLLLRLRSHGTHFQGIGQGNVVKKLLISWVDTRQDTFAQLGPWWLSWNIFLLGGTYFIDNSGADLRCMPRGARESARILPLSHPRDSISSVYQACFMHFLPDISWMLIGSFGWGEYQVLARPCVLSFMKFWFWLFSSLPFLFLFLFSPTYPFVSFCPNLPTSLPLPFFDDDNGEWMIE